MVREQYFAGDSLAQYAESNEYIHDEPCGEVTASGDICNKTPTRKTSIGGFDLYHCKDHPINL